MSDVTKHVIGAAIGGTLISQRLSETSAVVLERVAKGGGATNWFNCLNALDLHKIVVELSHGSVVSFYFDTRMCVTKYSEAVREDLMQIVSETGEVVFEVFREVGFSTR